MHGDEDIRIQFVYLRHDLAEVIGRSWPQVEAAHDRMDFLNAGYLLRLSDRIDYSNVTAGADNDQTLVFQIEASRVLVNVFVRHDLAFHLSRQIMTGVASGSVFHRKLHHAVGEHALDTGTLNLARCERLASDDDGGLR